MEDGPLPKATAGKIAAALKKPEDLQPLKVLAVIRRDVEYEFFNLQYSPSALLLGFTAAGRALHVQVSFAESAATTIITMYEADPKEWIEKRKRR